MFFADRSTLSQLLSFPSGVIQDGTGTRCPIRYTFKQNPSSKDRVFIVNGKTVKGFVGMAKAVTLYKKKSKKNAVLYVCIYFCRFSVALCSV